VSPAVTESAELEGVPSTAELDVTTAELDGIPSTAELAGTPSTAELVICSSLVELREDSSEQAPRKVARIDAEKNTLKRE
jgi:hypothetical protein